MRRKHLDRSNRIVRHFRIRKKVVGSAERPRLCVAPSIQHMEAQIIDDLEQKTLLGLSTKAKEFKKISGLKSSGNVKASVMFGKFVAERAKAKGIQKVVFDRGGYLYHGRIKAFADAAREQGLSF
jgi:large subunit ribosomal protein L18